MCKFWDAVVCGVVHVSSVCTGAFHENSSLTTCSYFVLHCIYFKWQEILISWHISVMTIAFAETRLCQKLVYKLFEISVYFFICICISYFLHLSQHGKETLSKIRHFFIITVFLLLCKILYYYYCSSCFTISKCPNTIWLNSISLAHVTMLYAHCQAALPAQFQISCLIRVCFQDASTHNMLGIQMLQCGYSRVHRCMRE